MTVLSVGGGGRFDHFAPQPLRATRPRDDDVLAVAKVLQRFGFEIFTNTSDVSLIRLDVALSQTNSFESDV